MAKTIDDHFRDWESMVFGFGYGTGELHVLGALRGFLGGVEPMADPEGALYSHEAAEAAIGPAVTWLLINTLLHAGILDYGTSARYGWLTEAGLALRDYVLSNSAERLCEVVGDSGVPCFPDHCQCREGSPCLNPFWDERRTR